MYSFTQESKTIITSPKSLNALFNHIFFIGKLYLNHIILIYVNIFDLLPLNAHFISTSVSFV